MVFEKANAAAAARRALLESGADGREVGGENCARATERNAAFEWGRTGVAMKAITWMRLVLVGGSPFREHWLATRGYWTRVLYTDWEMKKFESEI